MIDPFDTTLPPLNLSDGIEKPQDYVRMGFDEKGNPRVIVSK